jgi:hypothetical protein
MHAAARGEIGSAAGTVLLTGKLTGALTVLDCEMTGPGAGVCGAACGLASSFLHIRHLVQKSWIFEVVGLEGGATQKLQDSTGFSVCKAECQRQAPGCPLKQHPPSCIKISRAARGVPTKPPKSRLFHAQTASLPCDARTSEPDRNLRHARWQHESQLYPQKFS